MDNMNIWPIFQVVTVICIWIITNVKCCKVDIKLDSNRRGINDKLIDQCNESVKF